MDILVTVSTSFWSPYLSTKESSPTSSSPRFSSTTASLSSSRSKYVRASHRHTWTHHGSVRVSSSSHISHFRGRPESGSRKYSLDGHETPQKLHSEYSLIHISEPTRRTPISYA